MAEYIYEYYICPKCKAKTKTKTCPECGSATKGTGSVSVRFRIMEDGKAVYKRLRGFDTKREAEQAYRRYDETAAPKSEVTVEELSKDYLDNLRATAKPSSIYTIGNRVSTTILPEFGHRKANSLTTLELTKWQNKLLSQYSNKYVISIRSALSGILQYGKVYGIDNPIKEVKGIKKTKSTKISFWDNEEIELFLSSIKNPDDHVLFAFLILVGCRKGEAVSLKWSDVDFKTNTVHIERSIFTHVGNGQYSFHPPKNGKTRLVSFPQSLADELKEYRGDSPDSDFVFKGKSPMSFSTMTRRFENCIKAANEIKPLKRIRIHDLRHTSATYYINNCDNQLSAIYVISDRIGDTVEEILKTYGHLYTSRQKEAVDIFAKIKLK